MSSGRSSAMRRQAKAMEEANRIARERLEWQMGQMDEYERLYGGVERQTINDALRGVPAHYDLVTGRAASDVAQQFGQQRDQQRRQMMSFGLDPTSGRFQGMERQAGLREASTSALAQNQARQGERQRVDALNENRRGQALGFATNRFNLASSGIDSAYQGAQQGQLSAANLFGQQAQMADNRMAGIGQLVGTVGGAALGAWGGPAGMAAGSQIGGQMAGGLSSPQAMQHMNHGSTAAATQNQWNPYPQGQGLFTG